MQPHVSDLYCYPVKSAGRVRRDVARVALRGFEGDRRWMVVDPEGTFWTQRSHPRLALLRPRPTDAGLTLHWESPAADRAGRPDPVDVPVPDDDAETLEVEIWGNRVAARSVPAHIDRWLSERLGEPCRLVYMPESTRRQTETEGKSPTALLSFTDSKPFLLTTRASLRALNDRLASSLRMARFRPNIVVDGTEPFAEDDWNRIRIGEVTFHVVEACTRCAVTTVDQQTGERGAEPLKTLAEFRRTPDGDVAFGQYLVHESRGTLREGATVDLLD